MFSVISFCNLLIYICVAVKASMPAAVILANIYAVLTKAALSAVILFMIIQFIAADLLNKIAVNTASMFYAKFFKLNSFSTGFQTNAGSLNQISHESSKVPHFLHFGFSHTSFLHVLCNFSVIIQKTNDY